MRKTRGMALLVVLGVLAILALTATVFATLSGLERDISRNYLDRVRARLAAESGLEAAIALLQERIHRGTLWTETSWSVAGGRKIRVDGRDVDDAGFAGGGTYAPDGDFYTVRIADSNCRINVNDGAPGGPDHSVSRNLRRILNILGAQPTVDAPGLGDLVLRSRPPAGYADILALREVLGDRETYERVRPHLTIHAWSDPEVANPVPLSAETLGAYAIPFPRPADARGPVFRFGHQRNAEGELIRAPLLFFDSANGDPFHHAVWGRDSLNPQWIEIVSRSPVNVNTASREVLLALVIDLEGSFLMERRRDLPLSGRGAVSPCDSPGGAYAWTSLRYSYDGKGDEGDECGFLYRTVPFTGPGGRNATGIPAAIVVDEIIACRERRPFGSWAQFSAFVDALVERGVIADRPTGDVLKANFNPNLHLNEINPNRTLFTEVDKTDLIVHSTEFCFTPMGRFEIESTGRIVRPRGGGGHETLAFEKCSAAVKLYDAIRETSQASFYAGTFSERGPGTETSNNRSVESGPEPDNGPAPSENRYEGYLQLPTYGANFTKDETKPRNELWTTLGDPTFYPGATAMKPGGAHLGSAIHAHFQLDHAAHHHASRNGFTAPPFWDGFRVPQGAWQTVFGQRGCLNRNWEDRTESLPSPYSPVDGPRAGRDFRIARSFSGPSPAANETASSDLRLDGAYAERDSAFGYWIDENVSFNFNEGAAAFWMKPAFEPQATAKRRTLLSLARYHAAAPNLMNPSPFTLFFVPPHGSDEAATPSYAAGMRGLRPASLAFGLGFSSATGYSWEMPGQGEEDHAAHHAFVFSPTLNHEGHGDGKPSPLRANEWTHVGVTWRNYRNRLPTSDTVRLYVNGRILPDTVGLPHLFRAEGQPFRNTPWWSVHSLQAILPGLIRPLWVKNSIRLGGEPSRLFDLPGDAAAFPANFTADATLDEFYLWLDRGPQYNGGLWGLQTLWNRGRYYRPDDANPRDARFTSATVNPDAGIVRTPPPAPGKPEPVRIPPRRKVLGISWTEWAEHYEGLRPRMLDHESLPPRVLPPAGSADANGSDAESVVDLAVEADGASHGPYRNAAFSPVRDSSGAPLEIADRASLRYAAKLKVGGPRRPPPILLSTPVLDDVTLFYSDEPLRILSWGTP